MIRAFNKFHVTSKASALFLIAVLFGALFAPWLAPYDYDWQNTANTLAPPNAENWMGTDHLGRDLFSRILYGSRISLFVSFFTTVLAIVVGTLYGSVSGYAGGRTDHFMMRVVDVVYSLPDLLLIILITIVIGRGVTGIFLALTLVSWVTVARLVRGEVLRIKEFSFIEAAQALGSCKARILFHEILPNVWGLLIVTLTFRIPVAILAESTLSFIGLGIAPPFSSWGTLANDGWTAIKFYPHLIFFPSMAIFLTILACNFLGEGLRDVLDPRQIRRYT